MENDDSTPTRGAPYKDTPEVVPNTGRRMPISDPNANTAASKHSTGARDTTPNQDQQRQGNTAPYEDVTERRWEADADDLAAHDLDEAEAREQLDDIDDLKHVEGPELAQAEQDEWRVAEGEDNHISG